MVSNKHGLTDHFHQFQAIFDLFNRYKDIISKLICTAAEVGIILMLSTETQYVLLVVYFYTQTEITGICHS